MGYMPTEKGTYIKRKHLSCDVLKVSVLTLGLYEHTILSHLVFCWHIHFCLHIMLMHHLFISKACPRQEP